MASDALKHIPARSVATASLIHPPRYSTGSDAWLLLPALPIVAAIILGMALKVGPLTTAGTLAAIVAGVLSPAVGLITLVFMTPLLEPLVLPAPGFRTILAAAVVFGCVCRLPIDRPKLTPSPALLLGFGFVIYVATQQVPEMLSGYSGDRGHLVGFQFLQLLDGFALVVAAGYVLMGRRPGLFIAAALAAGVLGAVLAIATFNDPAVGSPIAALLAAPEGGRAVGPLGNPNYFGLLEATGIAASAAWAIISHSVRRRVALCAVIVLMGLGLLLSLSRGGMIALMAGLTGLAFARSRALGVAAVLLGVALVVAIYPAFIAWRLGYTNGAATGSSYLIIAESDASRLAGLLAGPKLFLSSPVFGVGWGHYSLLSGAASGMLTGIAAHNWYVEVLAELGTVGIVLWMLLLSTVVVTLWQRPPAARIVGFGVLATYAVGSMFLEAPASFQTSALPIVVIVAALVGDWTPSAEIASGRLVPETGTA